MSDSQHQLLQALLAKDTVAAAAAIDNGASADYLYTYVDLPDGERYHKIRPLEIAMLNDDDNTAAFIASKIADVQNLSVNHNETYLHIAATRNMPRTIAELARRGADMDLPLPDGTTPLDRALEHRKSAAFVELLEQGAAPYKSAGVLFMHIYGSMTDWKSCFNALFDAGEDLTLLDPNQKRHLDGLPNDAYVLCHQHLIDLKRKLHCDEGEGMPRFSLEENGKPSKHLFQILGAGELDSLFSAKRWAGHETEALQLYDRLAAIVPYYYREAYRKVDMTAISVSTLGELDKDTAVGRYQRQPKSQGGRQP